MLKIMVLGFVLNVLTKTVVVCIIKDGILIKSGVDNAEFYFIL